MGLKSAIFSGVLYFTASLSMTLVNKVMLNGYSFRASNFLLFLQAVVTVIFLSIFRSLKVIKLPYFDKATAIKLVPIAITYTANVYVSLLALSLTSVPVYNALKRLTPLMVILAEYIIKQKKQSMGVILSVGAIVIGAVVTGTGDGGFDLMGYMFALTSTVLQAYYLVSAKVYSDTGLSTMTISFYNSVLSMPFLFVLSFIFERNTLMNFPLWTDIQFCFSLIFLILIGSILGFSMFYCTNENSPLTFTFIGIMKGIIATIAGFMFWEVYLSDWGLAGLALNTMGSTCYALVKYRMKMKKAKIYAKLQPNAV